MLSFSRSIVVVATILLVCASAQAGTIVTGTNFRIDASTPVPVGNSLEAVTLTALALNGFNPNAFDGVTSSRTGFTTSGNLLHQVYQGAAPGSNATPALNGQQTAILDT